MKQVWKCIRKVQCFCHLCATKVNGNLEITSVHCSLDLGNRFELVNHLSTSTLQKTPSRIFIFATGKLWNYLVQVFLVGFLSYLLTNYTILDVYRTQLRNVPGAKWWDLLGTSAWRRSYMLFKFNSETY